jgi:AraC-like DNA-binding protein
MESLASWSRFVARHMNAPPLAYLSGMRHVVKKGVYCQMHSHRAIEIVYHPRGRGLTRLESHEIAFRESSAIIYAPEERHDQVMDCEGEDLCVTLAVPARYRGVPRQCFSVGRVEDAAIIEDIRILSQGRVDLTPTEQAIFNLRATSTLYALVHLAQVRDEENDLGADKYVQKAEQYIRDHFATLTTLREAAEHAGIGHDHLRHAVKAARGRSLVRYLTEVRIERAKTLLLHSRIPLKQVASQCGFRDEYYFSAVFRRLVGSPPGRYRARRS